MDRRTLLRCTAAVVAVSAAPPVLAATAAIFDEREAYYICETCERPLYEGDLSFVDPDGVALCEAHAPTWSDLKNEQDEAIRSGDFFDLFDDAEQATDARDTVLRFVREGRGDERVVRLL